MPINKIKGRIARALDRYKFRRFQDVTSKKLTPEEISLILPFAYFLSRPNVKVIYDIGAADGVFSSAGSKFKNVAKVVAFEPHPSAWTALNERIGGCGQVDCINIAVGDRNGSTRFFATGDNDSSSCLKPTVVQAAKFPTRTLEREFEVQVSKLDDLRFQRNLPYPDLIKIDTQGFELQVLRGATDCLQKTTYCIAECSVVELYEGSALINEVIAYMYLNGFVIVGAGPQLHDEYGQPLQVDLTFQRVNAQRGDVSAVTAHG